MRKPSDTGQGASGLEAHLGYWLRFVSNHVSQSFSRKLEARGVSVAGWVVMRHLLDHGPVAPSVVATRLGMTRGAITKIADRLIDKSFISREPSPQDGRAQLLMLTRAGQALVPALSAIADENDAAFFGHLKPAERKQLEKFFRDVVRRHALQIVPVD